MIHLNDILDLVHHMIGGQTASRAESSQKIVRYQMPQDAAPGVYISDPHTDELTGIPSDYGSSRSDRAA